MNSVLSTNRVFQRSKGILNSVARMHARSLAQYLTDARPGDAARFPRAMDTIAHIALDQQEIVERIRTELQQRNSSLIPSGFPMEFTGLHDLSMSYLLKRLTSNQQRDIDQLSQYVESLRGDHAAQALVEEALGAAKAHLDALLDCQSSPTR